MRLVLLAAALTLSALVEAASAATPSFDCAGAEASSIEALVCADEELAALDRRLADVYTAALAKAVDEHPPVLRAEQRNWIKGRDECWKADALRACVDDAYVLRIAELQARYRLVEMTGPVFFTCDGNPANEVVMTFFETEPPSAIGEYGDRVSWMLQQPAASGAKYAGPNETFWEHQGEARVTWGYQAPELRCVVRPRG